MSNPLLISSPDKFFSFGDEETRQLPPGMAIEFFGGGKTGTTTQSVQIPPDVLARYNSVNSTAQQVAQTPFQQYSTDPNAFVAPLTPTQQAGIANTNAMAGEAQPFYGAAAGLAGMAGPTNVRQLSGQQIGQYMNPFVQSVVNPTAQLLNQQQQAQMSGQTGQAIQQGAFGGDRAGIAAANLAGQQKLAFANAINPLYSQAYNTALQTAQGQQGVNLQQQQANNQLALQQAGLFGQLGAGAQAAGLQGAQAQVSAGTLGQQTQQAGLSALYNQFLQQQAYPFQTTQFLANIAEATGALSGSNTTTTQPQSFFSDERLKDDVEDIGRTHDGQKIVKFRYKGEKGPKQIGLIAQDVEKHHPEAVGLAGGYKTVDYDKATEDAASMGGSVVPERAGLGFAAGGYARIGYGPGGLVSPTDYDAIIQAQQSFLPPGQGRQMAGMPGGGKGVVPALASAHPHLMLADPRLIQPQKSEFQQGLGAVRQAKETSNDLSSAKGALFGSPANGNQAATPGLVADVSNWLNKPGQPMQLSGANAAPAPAASDASNWQTALDENQVGSAARGGLVRHHYDGGGDIPYGGGDDNSALGQVVDSGGNKYKLNQEAAPPSAQSQQQSGLGQLASVAGAAKTIAGLPGDVSSGLSGLSGLMGGGADAAAALAFLSKGGSVYREHHAGGRAKFADGGDTNNSENLFGQFGNFPNGHNQNGGLSGRNTPDEYSYHESAAPYFWDTLENSPQTGHLSSMFAKGGRAKFATGGLVPREHHADGDSVGDMDTAAGLNPDLPAPGAQEAAAQGPTISAKDRDMAIRTIVREAGEEPELGQAAVVHVINNRLNSGSFGKNISDIVTAPNQFTSWNKNNTGTNVDPRTVDPDSPVYKKIGNIFDAVSSGAIPDPTKGALNFANPRDATASWVQKMVDSGNYVPIGNHIFGTSGEVPTGLAGAAPTRTAQADTSPPDGGLGGGRTQYAKAAPTTMTDAGPQGGGLGAVGGFLDQAGDFFTKHQNAIVPILTGLATMASSPSRHLGSAILQGLGGGAQAYENLQNQMTQRQLAESTAQKTYADIALQSYNPNNKTIRVLDPSTGKWTVMLWGEYLDKYENLPPEKRPQFDPRTAMNIPPVIKPEINPNLANQPPSAGTTQEKPNLTNQPPAASVKQKPEVKPAAGAPASATPIAAPIAAPFTPEKSEIEEGVKRARAIRYGLYDPAADPNFYKDQAVTSRDAAKAQQLIVPLAKELSSLPRTGTLASGELQKYMQPIVAYANNLGRVLGNPNMFTNEDLMDASSAQEVVGKLATQLQGQQTSEAQQHALAALRIFAHSIPSNLNQPQAMAEMISQIMTNNQREIDKNVYFDKFRNAIAGNSISMQGPAASTGIIADRLFNEKYTNNFYQNERNSLSKMFGNNISDNIMVKQPDGTKKPTPVMQYLASGHEISEAAKSQLKQKYGSNVLRYFGIQ